MSNATVCTSNITSGFIDLATYDELEKYLYGGPSATAYFVRETRKATWFTLVPVVLSRANGNGDFGTDHSVNISRAGDYLLATWLRVTTPEISLTGAGAQNNSLRIRWTRNFMHNLIIECCITFNDLSAARFDNFHLDFWAAFTVPAGKQNGYKNMIGDIPDMTEPHDSSNPIPSFTLNLPLPFFYSRDSGVALPTAALPYNEMRITYSFRNWSDLLILDDLSIGPPGVPSGPCPLSYINGGVAPQLQLCQTWANYAIVSNDERKRMACAPRNILIEQVQTAPLQSFNPNTNTQPSYDLRFSHAIKVIFFACRNTTVAPEWSNYTAATPIPGAAAVNFAPSGAVDPIITTSLTYENTARLSNMGSDYYSLVQPWYHAPVIPIESGYHMYSYSLDFICLDPKGSTNYGKLTNVSIAPVASLGAITAAAGNGLDDSGANWVNTYRFVTTVVNNNIIRISGGALGGNCREQATAYTILCRVNSVFA
jgi:hypothetical protein